MVLCASLGTLPRFAFSREASCVQLPVLVCLRPSCCSVLQDNEQSPMSVLALAPTARAPSSPLVSARYPLFPSPLSTRSSRCLPLCVPGALAILHTAVSVRPLRSVCPRCALYSMHAPAALVPRPKKPQAVAPEAHAVQLAHGAGPTPRARLVRAQTITEQTIMAQQHIRLPVCRDI